MIIKIMYEITLSCSYDNIPTDSMNLGSTLLYHMPIYTCHNFSKQNNKSNFSHNMANIFHLKN